MKCERCGIANRTWWADILALVGPRFSRKAGRVLILCGACAF
jgi:hypothetical protein